MPLTETIRVPAAEMLFVESSSVKVPLFGSESLLVLDARSVAEGAPLSNADVLDIRPELIALCESNTSSNAVAVALLVIEALTAVVRSLAREAPAEASVSVVPVWATLERLPVADGCSIPVPLPVPPANDCDNSSVPKADAEKSDWLVIALSDAIFAALPEAVSEAPSCLGKILLL